MNVPIQQREHLLDPSMGRRLIARLPITMRPGLNQQLGQWTLLFPFEQRRLNRFLHGVEAIEPAALDALTAPLRALEGKMNVAHWNFSEAADTMENASQLARSQYYQEWRKEVRKVSDAIERAAKGFEADSSSTPRLVLTILPVSLPVDSSTAWAQWEGGHRISIAGDASTIAPLLLQSAAEDADRVAVGHGTVDSSDHWLIDAENKLSGLASASLATSSLSCTELKVFREKFLAAVNTVPKSISASDQVLDSVRHMDWKPLWPTAHTDDPRLRKFVIDLLLSGNGALIFSNAFVEWAASEALRRARPRLVVARFGLRSKPKPFTGIAIFENQQRLSALPDQDDPAGSAIDALILARYVHLAALRYPEGQQTFGLCVSENSNTALLMPPAGVSLPWDLRQPVPSKELASFLAAKLGS